MNKQEALINLSTIFNRGSSDDASTSFFSGVKHDHLLDVLLKYIQSAQALIGNPKIYKTQALNDHGVDLIVEFPNQTKIGLQIKSHFDVAQKDFALKVKSQMAESQYHGLDKWYLLICTPIKDGSEDYSSKVSHLINEFSSYKTSYHIVYNPQQCHNIFKGNAMTLQQFNSIKNQFYLSPVDWIEILRELKPEKATSGYLTKIEIHQEKISSTANEYLKYLGLGESEKESVLEDLEDLQLLLRRLTRQTREFLYAILLRAVKRDRLNQLILTPCQDLENYLQISTETVKKEVAILENHRIAFFDEDEGIWYIAIQKTNPNYNILEDIKDFCSKKGKPLDDIIVNLNFLHFDN